MVESMPFLRSHTEGMVVLKTFYSPLYKLHNIIFKTAKLYFSPSWGLKTLVFKISQIHVHGIAGRNQVLIKKPTSLSTIAPKNGEILSIAPKSVA